MCGAALFSLLCQCGVLWSLVPAAWVSLVSSLCFQCLVYIHSPVWSSPPQPRSAWSVAGCEALDPLAPDAVTVSVALAVTVPTAVAIVPAGAGAVTVTGAVAVLVDTVAVLIVTGV